MVGRGGHASEPSRALDPVPIACEIVLALQTMVSRRIDVFDPGILTVGRVVAGTTNNIIPESALVEGTMRAVSAATRQRLHDGVRRVAEGIAAAHGATAEVAVGLGYGVTVNDGDAAATALAVADATFGPGHTYVLPHPTMGAEDFSYFLQERPGCFFFVGTQNDDKGLVWGHHHPRFDIDEEGLANGIEVMVRVVERYLNS